jgi:hypothetical protein
MSPIQTGAAILSEVMAHLLPSKFDSTAARVQILANGYQESKFLARQQQGGPARSYWQMEQGGGIHGVLTSPATKAYARAVCGLCAVAAVESDVYAAFALPQGDRLACAFARLILWADTNPLPAPGDEEAAWQSYLRNWRPGKPRPDDWPVSYRLALATVQG